MKEAERKSKSQQEDPLVVEEEVKVTNAGDVEMIDTSAASPDKSILQGKPISPSVVDFKYESRYDIDSVDDIWQRVEYSYYHSLSDL